MLRIKKKKEFCSFIRLLSLFARSFFNRRWSHLLNTNEKNNIENYEKPILIITSNEHENYVMEIELILVIKFTSHWI